MTWYNFNMFNPNQYIKFCSQNLEIDREDKIGRLYTTFDFDHVNIFSDRFC